MSPAAAALACIDLHKRFAAEEVLRGVHLHVARGDVHCILGCSGAGKSVLARLAVGLLRPDAGRVVIDGRDLTDLTEVQRNQVRLQCQMIFQGSALFDQWRVIDNVSLPLRKSLGLARGEAGVRALEALRAVQCEAFAQAWPSTLGAGVRKRVAIARALALRPRTLLLDEPTSSLDPVTARRIDRLIRRMSHTYNMTALVVTHDLESVAQIADRVSFLHAGRIHFDGTAADLFSCSDPIVQRFVHAAPGIAQDGRLPCLD